MIKTLVFIKGRDKPFAYSGDEALEQVRSILPDISGYVQTRAIGESPFLGCAELYFDSRADADTASATSLAPLVAPSASIEASLSGIHRAVVRLPTFFSSDKVKGVYPFLRRAEMSVEDFQSYWWHTHGPIAALTENALAYYQTHPIKSDYELNSPDFDGVTEIYWPDIKSAEAAVVSRQMTEDQAADAKTFVDLDSVTLFFGVEEIIIAP